MLTVAKAEAQWMQAADSDIKHPQPLNTEPLSGKLTDAYITPNELVFNRNHESALPSSVEDATSNGSASAGNWTVTVSADGTDDKYTGSLRGSRRVLSLEQLQSQFALSEVVATLECAGNRRSELADSHPEPEGIQWGNAVIANVIWGGASLRSVLLAAGVADPFAHHASEQLSTLEPSEESSSTQAAEWAKSLHLHLLSAQKSKSNDAEQAQFAASIPLTTAMHPNQSCLLAYEYNHQPLTPRHGAPLRAVVPGHVGARWVKWLTALKVSTSPSDSPPMREDYKLLTPRNTQEREKEYSDKAKDGDFRSRELDKKQPIQRLEASCAITQPAHDAEPLDQVDGKVAVKGYAVGQDGSPATNVCVALVADPGNDTDTEDLLRNLPDDLHWRQASIHQQNAGNPPQTGWSWAWTLWHVQLPVPSASTSYAVIARCSKYHQSTP